ncbi:MAG: 30S ribosomal protein S12 methylthiotransferase RimO [Spirochaetaceae bacterium]|jgi:ribosomal protein S12 methylthiotransferase|nr:30S ribosomal protein S12 methylthiotransferase RimO [Spirochaetaceae bacterium]
MNQENTNSSSSLSIKSFYVENLGCSKNQVDAENMISTLTELGWISVDDPVEAELIIVNTCGFIKSAKEESISTILDFTSAYPDKKVLAAGCLSERYNVQLIEMIPELDGVFGSMAPSRVPEVLQSVFMGEKPVVIPETDLKVTPRKKFFSFDRSVYVKIAEGCNNRCTYCAIPIIKGDLKSRPFDDIISEIRQLVSDGVFELNLIAQDLAGYGTDRGEKELPKLLRAIGDIDGDFWIRLLYIHPDRFIDEVVDIIAEDKRFLPYFDIPFQHASTKILRKMGRRGSSESHLKMIQSIKDRLPHAVFRSTFMTGFPGETPQDFQALLDFQEKAQINWVGFFTYSREEDTPAWSYRGSLGTKLSEKKAARYKAILEENQTIISQNLLDTFLNKELDVLIEEKVGDEHLYLGRAYFQAPEVDGLIVIHSETIRPGDVVKVKIIKRNGMDLEAVSLED